MNLFAPDYTPLQMIKMGVFNGAYFASAQPDDFDELTSALAKAAKTQMGEAHKSNNHFKVSSGLSYDEWMQRGWIFDEDPLGWFHWYCRYHSGRRHTRDDHQIKRWHKYKDRWGRRIAHHFSPVMAQGLLHWGIDYCKIQL